MFTNGKVNSVYWKTERGGKSEVWLDHFENELLHFLSRNPSRDAVRSFVRAWYGQDEEMNREVFIRARFLVFLHHVCEEYCSRKLTREGSRVEAVVQGRSRMARTP